MSDVPSRMEVRHPRPLIVASAAGGVAMAIVASAAPVAAHTGHPTSGLVDGLIHPALGPDHLLAMVAVGVIAALAVDRRVAWLVPGGFLTGMLLGGLAGMAGVTFPGIELAVAASVVVLGLLVTGYTRVAEGWLPLVALLFGAAHGLAHGGELPEGATPFAYVGGFVVATALLHVVGLLGGSRLRSSPGVRAGIGAAVAAAGVGLVVLT